MATGDNDITMSEEEMGSVWEIHGDGSVRARSATPPPAPKKPPRVPARRAPTLALAPAHRIRPPPAPLPPPG